MVLHLDSFEGPARRCRTDPTKRDIGSAVGWYGYAHRGGQIYLGSIYVYDVQVSMVIRIIFWGLDAHEESHRLCLGPSGQVHVDPFFVIGVDVTPDDVGAGRIGPPCRVYADPFLHDPVAVVVARASPEGGDGHVESVGGARREACHPLVDTCVKFVGRPYVLCASVLPFQFVGILTRIEGCGKIRRTEPMQLVQPGAGIDVEVSPTGTDFLVNFTPGAAGNGTERVKIPISQQVSTQCHGGQYQQDDHASQNPQPSNISLHHILIFPL